MISGAHPYFWKHPYIDYNVILCNYSTYQKNKGRIQETSHFYVEHSLSNAASEHKLQSLKWSLKKSIQFLNITTFLGKC